MEDVQWKRRLGTAAVKAGDVSDLLPTVDLVTCASTSLCGLSARTFASGGGTPKNENTEIRLKHLRTKDRRTSTEPYASGRVERATVR